MHLSRHQKLYVASTNELLQFQGNACSLASDCEQKQKRIPSARSIPYTRCSKCKLHGVPPPPNLQVTGWGCHPQLCHFAEPDGSHDAPPVRRDRLSRMPVMGLVRPNRSAEVCNDFLDSTSCEIGNGRHGNCRRLLPA